MAVKPTAVKKEKKTKKWYPITAPSFFKDQVLGEIPSSAISNLVGRKISINLMSATRDFKHQDVTLTFTIDTVQGQTAIASVDAYHQSLSSLKRIIRRKTDRVDERVVVKTKDNVTAVVKVVMITLNNTYSKVLTKLRKATKDNLIVFCQGLTFIELVQSVINNRLPRDLKQSLNKVFPVRTLVITSVVSVKTDAYLEQKQAEAAKRLAEEKPAEVKADAIVEEKPAEAKEEAAEEKPAEETEEKPAEEKKPRKPRAKKKAEEPAE